MRDAAKKLRKSATDAEELIWRHLRARQLDGLKFRRQQPIDNYIVDFICFEKRIVVEADGGHHGTENGNDRDDYLGRQGFKVLRFWNSEILKNIEGVLEEIRRNCIDHPPQTPPVKGGDV
jgi:very-short-patch-repair endonuclease